MKNILTLLLLLITSSIFSQGFQKDRAHIETLCGEIPLVNEERANSIDTLYCERLNNDHTQYDPYTVTVFIYDEFGRIIKSEYGYYAYDGFRLSSLEEYTYTSFDSVETYVGYYWNDTLNETGAWDATNMKIYTYHSNNQLQSEMWMFNPIGEDMWNNQRLIEYQYDNGELIQIDYSVISQETNTWRKYMRTEYQRFDNLLESVLQYYSNDGVEWRNTYKYSYYYSTDQMVRVEQHLNGEHFANNRKHTYDLDENGNVLIDLEQHWNSFDSIWDTLILDQKQYTYDSYGNNTGYLHRSAYFEWFNVDKAEYAYFDNQLISGVQYRWDWNVEQWYEYVKCSIKTSPGILSTNEPNFKEQVSVYPNPIQNEFAIQLPESNDNVSIRLYDISGKTLMQYDYLPQNIQLFGLNSGIYFVEINLDNEIITRRLVKQ